MVGGIPLNSCVRYRFSVAATKVEVAIGRLGVGQPFPVVEQLHDPSAVDVPNSLESHQSTPADAHRCGGDRSGQRAGDVAAVAMRGDPQDRLWDRADRPDRRRRIPP
jgi:hypothetical protein